MQAEAHQGDKNVFTTMQRAELQSHEITLLTIVQTKPN
jgi:hypothetical protein